MRDLLAWKGISRVGMGSSVCQSLTPSLQGTAFVNKTDPDTYRRQMLGSLVKSSSRHGISESRTREKKKKKKRVNATLERRKNRLRICALWRRVLERGLQRYCVHAMQATLRCDTAEWNISRARGKDENRISTACANNNEGSLKVLSHLNIYITGTNSSLRETPIIHWRGGWEEGNRNTVREPIRLNLKVTSIDRDCSN